MRNIARNTLKYAGIVTISQYINSKKVQIAQIQNTGYSPLFDFLADCLAADFDMAKEKRPTKIRLISRELLSSDPIETYEYKEASGFVYLLTKPEKVAEGRVRYSFLIPRDMLEAVTDYNNLGLGLYTKGATDQDIENFAAFCELSFSRNALTNASLVVDWELVITNK